jgi:hypothetical protein
MREKDYAKENNKNMGFYWQMVDILCIHVLPFNGLHAFLCSFGK